MLLTTFASKCQWLVMFIFFLINTTVGESSISRYITVRKTKDKIYPSGNLIVKRLVKSALECAKICSTNGRSCQSYNIIPKGNGSLDCEVQDKAAFQTSELVDSVGSSYHYLTGLHGVCPDGFEHNEDLNACYKFVLFNTAGKTQDEALEGCPKEQHVLSFLADETSLQEHEYFKQRAEHIRVNVDNNKVSHWIGAYKPTASVSSFYWRSSGRNMDWLLQPKNTIPSSGDCFGLLRSTSPQWGWFRAPCGSYRTDYICEIELLD